MTGSSPLTVVVADDQPLFRAGLTRAIQHHPGLRLVGDAGDGRALLDVLRDTQADLVVLALTLASLDGIAVLAALRRERLPTRALLVAAQFDEQDVRRGLGLGAAGLVSRRADGREMLDALLAIGRGEQVVDPRLGDVTAGGSRFERDDGTRPITAREHEVLQLMAEGMSGPQIARELFVSPSTVKSHIENLYGKLGVSHRGAAVAEGMRRGLLD